jgi:hypothetical protein
MHSGWPKIVDVIICEEGEVNSKGLQIGHSGCGSLEGRAFLDHSWKRAAGGAKDRLDIQGTKINFIEMRSDFRAVQLTGPRG